MARQGVYPTPGRPLGAAHSRYESPPLAAAPWALARGPGPRSQRRRLPAAPRADSLPATTVARRQARRCMVRTPRPRRRGMTEDSAVEDPRIRGAADDAGREVARIRERVAAVAHCASGLGSSSASRRSPSPATPTSRCARWPGGGRLVTAAGMPGVELRGGARPADGVRRQEGPPGPRGALTLSLRRSRPAMKATGR
jgi:hypothetical protein